jgi:hypothetical protein
MMGRWPTIPMYSRSNELILLERLAELALFINILGKDCTERNQFMGVSVLPLSLQDFT